MGNDKRSDTDVLIKEFDTVKVKAGGEVLDIGRISFIRLMKLMKLVAAMFLKNSDRFKNISAKGTTAYEDVMNVLQVLDENEVLEFESLLADRPIDFCKKLTFSEVSEIIRVSIDLNYDDVKATLKNWEGTIEKLKIKK